jgi:hypothetical protein
MASSSGVGRQEKKSGAGRGRVHSAAVLPQTSNFVLCMASGVQIVFAQYLLRKNTCKKTKGKHREPDPGNPKQGQLGE